MYLRPNAVGLIADDHVPAACAACSAEPFHRPDLRAKRHSRPRLEKAAPRVRIRHMFAEREVV